MITQAAELETLSSDSTNTFGLERSFSTNWSNLVDRAGPMIDMCFRRGADPPSIKTNTGTPCSPAQSYVCSTASSHSPSSRPTRKIR